MPDRVLVAYATKYGATAEIADAIGTTLRSAGFDVEVKRARDVDSVNQYRAVVVGSAVYMARWRRDALQLLRRQQRELANRQVWLFSSGPVGEPTDDTDTRAERWTKPKRVQQLASAIGARDHVVFGGRVSTDGGFLRRNMAKNTPTGLRDRRDWDAINAWAQQIGASLS